MGEMECDKLGICGGCGWGLKPFSEQRQLKAQSVAALSRDFKAEFAELASQGLRDRVDLLWQDGRLGLYALDRREVVAFERCPMMSKALHEFFLLYRQIIPPIGKGSVRLRVSPSGQRGAWLDFANADVKHLFDEKSYLQELSRIAFVEIGQRRKALIWKDGAPKLVEPHLQPWFETYDAQMQPLALHGPVGGFSQAGFAANRALIATVAEAAGLAAVRDWLELFSGNGNFALALAARGWPVEAVELDPLAVAGLEKSLQEHPELPVQVICSDVYLKSQTLPKLAGRGLLVDPPRAGLCEVLALVAASPEKPQAILYVSCLSEVLVRDASALFDMGYRLRFLRGVDQFAHSSHCEWVALFTF